MKVVIDISEEDYLNLIKTDENGEKEIPLGLLMSLWDCVKYNCTPLPKDHGRLIDGDSLIKAIEEKAKRLSNADTINGLCGAVALIFDAPTIIPTDKESEEEE